MAPFAKTGGLGDVLGALPAAQARAGLDVTVALPYYGFLDVASLGGRAILPSLSVPIGSARHAVDVWQLMHDGVRVLFIEHPSFDRDGVYGDRHGWFGDNPWRFALLGRAALAACEALGIWPSVVHGHDWPMGAAMTYARRTAMRPPATVFSIHNLAYRGLESPLLIDLLGLPRDGFHPDGYEFYGEISLLKAGLWASDRWLTVSPRYATEIKTPRFGEGLDGYLRAHESQLAGIVNGVDYRIWNPETDSLIEARYSNTALAGKAQCKAVLQHALGLPIDHRPLCAVVSRLTDQKGIDLIADALLTLADEPMTLIVLGAGDASLAERVRIARPADVRVHLAVDEGFAHRVYAAADLFVMPSRFEPCGLGQLYALRYGALPIVTPVGGLLDTVHDDADDRGTGFLTTDVSSAALATRWRDALRCYHDDARFTALRLRAMAQRFDWGKSAEAYLAVYRDALASLH